jgi:hypothetical protein
VSDKTAPQPEAYWRARIAQEIRDYDEETHRCYGHGCKRCDISATLRNVARIIARKEMWEVS